MKRHLLSLFAGIGIALLLAGCAAPPKTIDYSAFKASKPRSIVVLPPLNESADVKATYGMLAQATRPLAESGYYVMPVGLVDETFRQNGLTIPADIHAVAPRKLHDIFGADAALYVTVTQYGTKYLVFKSVTVVAANAKLVDLKTGDTLWTGSATASSDENSNNNNGGLLGALITAAVTQVLNHSLDTTYQIAGTTSSRLLWAGPPTGILYGPRSPKYGSD